LQSFQVTVQETDLMIQAEQDLSGLCREEVLTQRGYIEQYIRRFPEFLRTLTPWTSSEPAPEIVRRMISAGQAAGVGPMAAVAGAIAEAVGEVLCRQSKEVVVENGGDIYLVLQQPVTIGLYAGQSPISMRTGIRLDSDGKPLAVCTSSGTIGHSLSLGRADAVCVVARQCALADAAATAVANRISDARDIPDAIRFARSIEGIEGVTAICGERLGLWGDLHLVKLDRRKKVEF
jgi:ApbE superfamily uncharacterized protein (UPF0280 family)